MNIKGGLLKDLGHLDLSIKAYTEALSIKPDYFEAYNNMGLVLKKQGKLDKAIQAYKKSLSIKPNFEMALNNMGIVLLEQGKLSKAIQAYKQALSIKPNYAEATNNFLSLRIQLLGTTINMGQKNDPSNGINSMLLRKPRYIILQAICAFLKPDQNLVGEHLKEFSNCDSKLMAKLDRGQQVFCASYNSLLSKLNESLSVTKLAFINGQTVFHLGESH